MIQPGLKQSHKVCMVNLGTLFESRLTDNFIRTVHYKSAKERFSPGRNVSSGGSSPRRGGGGGGGASTALKFKNGGEFSISLAGIFVFIFLLYMQTDLIASYVLAKTNPTNHVSESFWGDIGQYRLISLMFFFKCDLLLHIEKSNFNFFFFLNLHFSD